MFRPHPPTAAPPRMTGCRIRRSPGARHTGVSFAVDAINEGLPATVVPHAHRFAVGDIRPILIRTEWCKPHAHYAALPSTLGQPCAESTVSVNRSSNRHGS